MFLGMTHIISDSFCYSLLRYKWTWKGLAEKNLQVRVQVWQKWTRVRTRMYKSEKFCAGRTL